MPDFGMPSIDEGMNKQLPPTGKEAAPPENARGEKDPSDDRAAKRRQKKDDQKIIKRAMKRYKRCMDSESDNRKSALEDLKFKAGEQWPAQDKARRAAAKRPCLTINTAPTLTHQISNDIRQNRPGINISPLAEATKEAAELYASFIRAIERDSMADVAYDTAVTSAVDIGFGYMRLLTDYETPDSDDQILVIKRVRNPFTVLLDYARQETDGSDSRFGFVSELVDREDFTEDWPKANPVSWEPRMVGTEYHPWATRDQLRVAEYFEIEIEKRRLVRLSNGHVGFHEDLSAEVLGMISDKSLEILSERESELRTVMWYRMTCLEVLERKRWLGRWIPIIEVLGEEIDLEGKVIRSGVIRNAKDPMRMKNYWATTRTELYGLQPKAPWVAPEGSFLGYEDEWDRAHEDNITRLEYVAQTTETGQPLPAPARQPPPPVASGLMQAEQQAEQDVMGTTGVRFNAQSSERLHDESGKAIREIRRNNDIGSFHYSDNFSRSLRFLGTMIIDLVPHIYNRRRIVPGLGEDGKEAKIMIDPDHVKSTGKVQPADPKEEPIKVLNPTYGRFGVTVTIGPSYATRRIEAQESLEAIIGKIPEPMRGVAAALMAKYSDWPGANELYKALAKMLPPGVLAPDQAGLAPEVSALVGQLNQKITEMTAERARMIKDLTDQREDRAIQLERINKDFEAKMMKLFVELKKAVEGNDLHIIGELLHAEERFMQRSSTSTGGRNAGDGQVIPLAPRGPGQGEAPMAVA